MFVFKKQNQLLEIHIYLKMMGQNVHAMSRTKYFYATLIIVNNNKSQNYWVNVPMDDIYQVGPLNEICGSAFVVELSFRYSFYLLTTTNNGFFSSLKA